MTGNLYTRTKNKIRYFFRPKAIALSYHRIANVSMDPWQLAVSPENFEQQLKVLKKYQVLTAAQLAEHLSEGSLKTNMVCITFDDGYQDNYWNAAPLLKKYAFPATIFIPTAYIGLQKQFWWDELQFILLGPHSLPEKLSLQIREKLVRFNLSDDSKYDKGKWMDLSCWKWYEPPQDKRTELYLLLWKHLRPLPSEEIIALIDKVKSWASVDVASSHLDHPVTMELLTNLSNDPLWSIGIHTVSHPALAFHSKEMQYNEIAGNKKALEQVAKRDVSLIAYPYGVYNKETIEVCKELKLKAGFTTSGSAIFKTDNAFELGRMHVQNWNGREFEKKLVGWLRGINFSL